MSDPTKTDIPIETSNGHDGTSPSDNHTMTDPVPASPAQSVGSIGRASFQSHARTTSNMSGPLVSGRLNRFSVHFPVQPAGAEGSPRRSISPLRGSAPEEVPVEASTPSDGNFLQSIAAAERKVLEMREELHRAEADLDKLKRQWTRHEAQKKREDARRSTKMQPLQTNLPAADREEDSDGSSAWMQHEMERRKALLNGSRMSNRTVLPGQRHTRTLSLLSPARDNMMASPATAPRLPPRKDFVKNGEWQDLDRMVQASRGNPMPLARASTISDFGDSADKALQASLNLNLIENNIDQEAILRTGKKMAATFKDGLWTFWEDLRQATVGEDATQEPPTPRKKNSTQTLKMAKKQTSRESSRGSTVGKTSADRAQKSPTRKQSEAGLPDLVNPSFWSEHGVAKDATPVPRKKKSTKRIARSPSTERPTSVATSEPWDTWDDSPDLSRYGSSVTSDTNTLPSTVGPSPRTSVSLNNDLLEPQKKDPLPWPVMRKTSGLNTLRRTASNLMKDWETSSGKTSPTEEMAGQSDFLGASAEAQAYAANSTTGKMYRD